jgi:hypothetical protein
MEPNDLGFGITLVHVHVTAVAVAAHRRRDTRSPSRTWAAVQMPLSS